MAVLASCGKGPRRGTNVVSTALVVFRAAYDQNPTPPNPTRLQTRSIAVEGVFYDRGRKSPLNVFCSTQNRRNGNLVSRNGAFVYLGRGTVHRDAI